jgi:cell division protein FtsI (penicillin-binding protein 3)
MRIRSIVAICVVAAGLVLLIGRAFYIQVLKGDEFAGKSLRQSMKSEIIPGPRGRIFDARGNILARNVPAYSVWMYVPDAENVDVTLKKISEFTTFEMDKVKFRVEHGGLFVPVVRRVPVEAGHRLQDAKLRGVHLLPDQDRVYPLGEAGAPLVGSVGFEGEGLTGVEAAFNEGLAGRPGKLVVVKDGAGHVMGFEMKPDERPMAGRDLYLTVHSRIQEAAFKAVEKSIADFGAAAASAVVVDIRTGKVLAVASSPSFDPDEPGKANMTSIRLRPITDAFEPGSSFKPFVMSGALELGLVSLDEKWDCENGAWQHGKRTLHDVHPYSILDTAMVIVKSSNIGMAKVGVRIFDSIGFRGFYEIVSAFGFGRETGIGLPGETPGLLLPHTQWTSYSVTSIPMGQEIAVSPLQLSLGYAALANGGWLLSPRLADKWRLDSYEESIPEVRPPRRVISQKTSDTIRGMLERVVLEGTGKKAKMEDYRVGGKTGTAQKAENGHYVDGKYTSVFVGFAPAENPKIVCAVLIDEPNKAHYGGTVAAPAFKEIMEAALIDLEVPPSAPRGNASLPAASHP